VGNSSWWNSYCGLGGSTDCGGKATNLSPGPGVENWLTALVCPSVLPLPSIEVTV